jgi:hypothetical protein
MEMKNNVDRLHSNIGSLWKNIKKAKGYKEWISANVSCYLVAFQMKCVAEEIAVIIHRTICIPQSQEENLDYLFLNMSNLYDEFMYSENVDGVSFNNLLEQQTTLNSLLDRALYVVQ